MSSTDVAVDTNEAGEGAKGAAAAKSKFGLKQILLFIVAPLVLLGGAGAGVYFSGVLGGGEEEHAEVVKADPVFYELPEFVANLNATAPMRFLKMKVALEITDKESSKRLDAELPRVLDTFQAFLRELRPEDVDGSAGMLRVKEELLRRIDLTIRPTIVTDVLVKEIIVQ